MRGQGSILAVHRHPLLAILGNATDQIGNDRRQRPNVPVLQSHIRNTPFGVAMGKPVALLNMALISCHQTLACVSQ